MYNFGYFGIVGFSRCEGDWCWRVLIVRGPHYYRIPLPYPIYLIVKALYIKKINNNLKNFKKV